MSVSTIGSNASNLADLINQRRQSLQAVAASVQSGDLAGAQQSLATAQSDTTSIDAVSASSGLPTNPYRSSLSTDLTSLSSALQSGDTSQAKAALTTFQTDLSAATGATGATQGTSGAHHAHHHHGGGGGGSSESSSQQIANALFSPDQTSTDTALGTDASSTSGDVLSQLLASLDARQG